LIFVFHKVYKEKRAAFNVALFFYLYIKNNIMRQMKITAESAIEPVSLADAKNYIKVDFTDDDTLIRSMINMAIIWCENYLSRDIVSKTRKYYMDKTNGLFDLPFSPVTSISSVKINGVAATYDVLGLNNETIELHSGAAEKVEVEYITEAVFNDLIQGAILQLVSTYYDNRAEFVMGVGVNEIPTNVKAILASQKSLFI